jgi:hypothetical protein
MNPVKAKHTTEKMKTVSFQIKPTDYELAREMFAKMGLSIGAGIRLAITELMRSRKEGKYEDRTGGKATPLV